MSRSKPTREYSLLIVLNAANVQDVAVFVLLTYISKRIGALVGAEWETLEGGRALWRQVRSDDDSTA